MSKVNCRCNIKGLCFLSGGGICDSQDCIFQKFRLSEPYSSMINDNLENFKVFVKILEITDILSGKDYKLNFTDQLNGVYRFDIKRHEDDFWQSEEYKECKRILGDALMEGTYGSDTYTMWIKAEIDISSPEYQRELPKPTQSIMNDAILAFPDDKEKRAAYITERVKERRNAK